MESEQLPTTSFWTTNRLLAVGWAALFVSAADLAVSSRYVDSSTPRGQLLFALFLMAARIAGITGFAMGVVGLFHKRWTQGSLLLIFSLALPFLSILAYGTL